MQRFRDVLQDRGGNAVVGASVRVQTYPGAVDATIYSDDGVTVQGNPITTGANGEFSFYAADGRYQLVVTATGYSTRTITDIILEDPAAASAGVFTTLSVSGAATLSSTLAVTGAASFSSTVSAAGQFRAADGSASAPSYSFTNATGMGWLAIGASTMAWSISGAYEGLLQTSGVRLPSDSQIGWSSNADPSLAVADTILARDSAGVLAQRNGANAQTFRVYGTYTDATNYEHFRIQTGAGSYILMDDFAGTGLARAIYLGTYGNASMFLRTNNTDRWVLNGSGHFVASTDATYDFGASGANRPRDLYLARKAYIGGDGTLGLAIAGGGLEVSRSLISFVDIKDPSASGKNWRVGTDSNSLSGNFFVSNLSSGSTPFQISAADGGLKAASAGPHVFGGSVLSTMQFEVKGSGAFNQGIRVSSTLSPAVGADGIGLVSVVTLNKAASGTHNVFTGLWAGAPVIGAGAATVTNAASIYIPGAPTGATNNYALWVAGGITRVDGPVNGAAVFRSDQPANANADCFVGTGTTGNIQLVVRGANAAVMCTSGNVELLTNGGVQLMVAEVVSAVNYVQVAGAATTASPAISAQGSDANLNLNVQAKGTGAVALQASNGALANVLVASSQLNAVNYVEIIAAATGGAASISAQGEVNVDLALSGKGTGNVRFGTHSAVAAETVTGYITIKDAGGVSRKLAVVS